MNGQLDLIMRRIWERKLAFFGTFFVVVLLTYAILVIIDFIPEPKEEVQDATEEVLGAMPESDDTEYDEIDEESNRSAFGAFVDILTGNTENAGGEGSMATDVTEGPTDEPVFGIAQDITTVEEHTTPSTEMVSAVDNPLPVRIIFEDLNNKSVPVLNPAASDIASLDAALLKGVVRHPDSADFSEPGNIFILGHSSYLPNVINKNFQAFNGIQKLTWGDTIRVQTADMEYSYRVEEVFEAPASEIFVPATPGEAKLTLATCNVLGAKEDRFVVEAKLVDSKPL